MLHVHIVLMIGLFFAIFINGTKHAVEYPDTPMLHQDAADNVANEHRHVDGQGMGSEASNF